MMTAETYGPMDLEPRFTWRAYQRDVLARLEAGDITPPLHLVAPPGSGKTLLGLELARRRGDRALVLSPTTAVAEQWVEKLAMFLPDGSEVAAYGGRDPESEAWLTSITYQMLSTVRDASEFFAEEVATRWADELVLDGTCRDDAEAAAWIARLADANPARHRDAIRRRSVATRRALLAAAPDEVGRFLHPHAVEILDSFVAGGVATVILDECHHLLDHWALVVRYLIGRIEASGREPYVVGLTATPPDASDERSYENYVTLLGNVDFDVPIPSVVREGDLAPFRELLYLTMPLPAEQMFLADVDAAFARVVEPTLGSDRFVHWMLSCTVDGVGNPSGEAVNELYEDPDVGHAAAWWFRTRDPQSRIAVLFAVPPVEFTATSARLALLARYARDVLLLDPECDDELTALKHALADFGITLTDRGIRQGRSVGDLVLSLSSSKSIAAEGILRTEWAAIGSALRAIVVCDFESHANRLGRTEHLLGENAGSATRAFEHLARCRDLAPLTPVLMTASLLRIAGDRIDEFVAAVNARLAEGDDATRIQDPGPGPEPWRELVVTGPHGAELTRAVSEALAAGLTQCLVATRGLIGEGWDCPPSNTLIDLTGTASVASSRQLRGRTLRLDGAWPTKVAHNWSVACIDPDHDGGDIDLVRTLRRHDHLFGPDLMSKPEIALDGTRTAPIVTGLQSIASKPLLTMFRKQMTRQLIVKALADETSPALRGGYIEDHNSAVLRTIDDRSKTYRAWGVGTPYLDEVGSRASIEVPRAPTWRGLSALLPLLAVLIGMLSFVLVTMVQALGLGPQLGPVVIVVIGLVVAVPLIRATIPAMRALLRGCPPDAIYLDGARAVLEASQQQGRIAGGVRVVASSEQDDTSAMVTIALAGATSQEGDTFIDLLDEVFGPVRKPRFLIRRNDCRLPVYRRRLLNLVVKLLARHWFASTESYVVVPNAFGRRAESAQGFFRAWQRHVGPGELIEVRGAENGAVLARARAKTRPTRLAAYRAWE